MKPRFAFVSHAQSGDVHTLLMTADGHLSPMHTLALGGTLMPMALSPCRRWLYVARRSEPMQVLSLGIDPQSGQLSLVGQAALPASMAYLSTDHHGRWLLAASYPDSCISVSAIGPAGVVGHVIQRLDTPAHAHAVVVSPDNRYVLVSSLGGDQILLWQLNAQTGQLSAHTPRAWHQRPGAGPRHLRFSPNGRFVYVLNELDATLDVLAYDDHLGTLRHEQTLPTAPPHLSAAPAAADLHLTPDGRLLFTSERTSSTLAAFSVDPNTGRLSPLGHTPTEEQPRGFAIDPSGLYLLALGQRSHHLSRYRIDPHSAALTLEQRLPMGAGPNWITFSP